MIYSQKGNTLVTTPIIVIICITFMTIIFMIIINLIMPYIWYQKLSNLGLKYMFIVEHYGYLSDLEKENLKHELESQGFEKEKIDISSTTSKKEYGEPVFLNISYIYNMQLPKLKQGLNIEYKNKTIKMTVWKNGVSKI